MSPFGSGQEQRVVRDGLAQFVLRRRGKLDREVDILSACKEIHRRASGRVIRNSLRCACSWRFGLRDTRVATTRHRDRVPGTATQCPAPSRSAPGIPPPAFGVHARGKPPARPSGPRRTPGTSPPQTRRSHSCAGAFIPLGLRVARSRGHFPFRGSAVAASLEGGRLTSRWRRCPTTRVPY